MNLKHIGWTAALLFGFAGLMFGGTKEELIRLQKDILTLQTQVRDLQRSMAESSGALKVQLEQLNTQSALTNTLLQSMKEVLDLGQASQKSTLSDLLMELRSVNVRLDETHTRIDSMAAQYAETKLQVESLRNPPRMLIGGGESGLPVSPEQVYLASYNDYLQGNFDVAIQGFQAYILNFQETDLADNAQFFIGECYYAQGKYSEAVLMFDQVINLYPKGDKIASARLKKGLSLLEAQRHEEAVEEFKTIVTKHSDSPEIHIARQRLELLGINVDDVVKNAAKKKTS